MLRVSGECKLVSLLRPTVIVGIVYRVALESALTLVASPGVVT